MHTINIWNRLIITTSGIVGQIVTIISKCENKIYAFIMAIHQINHFQSTQHCYHRCLWLRRSGLSFDFVNFSAFRRLLITDNNDLIFFVSIQFLMNKLRCIRIVCVVTNGWWCVYLSTSSCLKIKLCTTKLWWGNEIRSQRIS